MSNAIDSKLFLRMDVGPNSNSEMYVWKKQTYIYDENSKDTWRFTPLWNLMRLVETIFFFQPPPTNTSSIHIS